MDGGVFHGSFYCLIGNSGLQYGRYLGIWLCIFHRELLNYWKNQKRSRKTRSKLLFNFEESEVNEWNEWIQSVQPSEINQKKYHSIFCAQYPQYQNPLDAGINI